MQALSALLFLYREVLGRPVGDLRAVVRARAPTRPPVVLARDEVRRLLGALRGDVHLVALLLYGSGLRLQQAVHGVPRPPTVSRRILLLFVSTAGASNT